MGAGRKKKTLRLKEKPQPQWTVNCSVSARNLRKSDLGAVIFGCKHNTFGECKSSQLFGLPSSHFSYVKNVTPGLTLFLFNYSNRKLHGIFEAASPGQLNINSYGWTADGKESTPYPAQVQFRVRKQCRPLLEEEFAPIIADNYYEPMLFWFELDRTQTSKLIDLFSSSPSQLPSITPSLNTAVWGTRSNALPASDSKKVGDAVKAPVSEEMADNPDDVGTEWDTWETTAVKPNQETAHSYASVLSGKNTSQETFHSYASILSSKNNSLPQKPWISFSKASSSSGGLQKEETLKTQASKVLSLSDKSNMEWESSCVSSYLPKEQQFEACSDGWDTEGNEEPVDKSSSIESPMQEQITDSLPLNTSNEFLPTVDVREESRWLKSFASDLHLQQYHEPNTEWKMSCITHAFDGESRPSEASMENDAREIHNDVETCSKDSVENHKRDTAQLFLSVGEYAGEIEPAVACTVNELKSSDILSVVAQLMQEIEGLKGSQLKQNLKINSLELELVQSQMEVQHLRNQYNMLASHPASSSSGQFEEVEFETFKPFLEFDSPILIVGGFNSSSWLSTLSLYSPTRDLIKYLSPMTFMRSYTSAAKLNGELYLFGGVNGDIWYDTVESYNLTHKQWVTRPSLNQKKGSLAGVSIFEKLFAIGGGNGVDCFSEVEMFDMNIGKWIFTQSMQHKRFAPAVADINGALYVVGGYNGADYLKAVERFDPREPKWTGLASMNTKRGCHSLVALNEKLYALGGYDGEKMVSTVEIFDPRVCSWMMGESMKDARGYSGAVVIGGKIYAIGGTKDHEEILDTIECYEEGYGWQVTNLKALGKRCFFSALVL